MSERIYGVPPAVDREDFFPLAIIRTEPCSGCVTSASKLHLTNWLTVLEAGSGAIVTAAVQAQRVADDLRGCNAGRPQGRRSSRDPCASEALNPSQRRAASMPRTKPNAAAIPTAFQGLART